MEHFARQNKTCVEASPCTAKAKKKWMFFIVLLLLAAFCIAVWYMPNFYRTQFAEMTTVESENGVYDLTEIDFSSTYVRLSGDLTYIPEILTSEEYAAKESEAVLGSPEDEDAATSRMILLLPDDGYYTVVRSSVDYAYRAYINGELRCRAGTPADTAASFEPGYAEMQADVEAENGEIEIVQQGANFVHRQSGEHSGVYIGSPGTMSRFLAITEEFEYINFGLFAALSLALLILFVARRDYLPNLYLALLCFTWMVRTAVTGYKIVYALFPSFPWELAFRLEYLTIPAAFVLLILTLNELLPGMVQKWFIRTACVIGSAFAILCIFASTIIMSWALLGFYGVYVASALYVIIRFCIRIRSSSFNAEQKVSLIAYVIFMYAAIHDALYHMDAPLPAVTNFEMSDIAMLLFAFFETFAMFYATMRQVALAHEQERRALAESDMLIEMNRLKNAFYADMSHEMKTPLTVISINAQFAAKQLRDGAVSEEMAEDLEQVSDEARRLARMVTSLVGLGRMQSGDMGDETFDMGEVIRETARIYESLLAKKKNSLVVAIAPDLPLVTGSADRVIQVLINLLANANRHTMDGRITIAAEPGGEEIHVSVADTGEGVPPELLPHVFERFVKGENGGTGLGLYICKMIIEEHGGKIGMESGEGGSKVSFTLPKKGDSNDG